MERKSREAGEQAKERSDGGSALVPFSYWKDLASRDAETVCRNSAAKIVGASIIEVPFLERLIRIDRVGRRIWRSKASEWEPVEDPDLERIVLLYLLGSSPAPVLHEWVGVGDLKVAHFFRGPHRLKTEPLVDRYGTDPKGLSEKAAELGGEPLDMADQAFRFDVFPKIPLAYLYWKGDEDFPPEFSVLFDRSVEAHLPGDAIWGMVNLVTDALSGIR